LSEGGGGAVSNSPGAGGTGMNAAVNGADGMSIMALMALAAGQGSSLHVEARGKDASKAVEYVGRLVKEGFGEL